MIKRRQRVREFLKRLGYVIISIGAIALLILVMM